MLTTGNSRPNTQMFEQDFPNVLTPQGFIKVLPTLQVEGTENIFALGDAANIPVSVGLLLLALVDVGGWFSLLHPVC